jgi:hypothetical protein
MKYQKSIKSSQRTSKMEKSMNFPSQHNGENFQQKLPPQSKAD